ncbi:MAG: penicillin acylase family protein [Verrucomicrobiales bacterium]|nr:penicillin acylase family protein [Verrucomicrobiales bacterium]
MPRLLIWCFRVAGILLATVVGLALILLLALTSSRATLEGNTRIASLGGDVVVDRDDHGVPTIQAGTQADAIRALGFLHGQERFFQMDLLRRTGAGDLAELFGPAVLEMDLLARRHDVRGHRMAAMASLDATERSLLDAYTEGVNAGLDALRVRPPEYLLLRRKPQPWHPEDSLAVMAAMAFALQDPDGVQESMLGVMHRTLSPAAFAFFAPRGTEWDAALDGSEFPAPPIPTPEEFTAPDPPPGPMASAVGMPGRNEELPGSNGWAIGGSRTSHGGALVADDMHLDLRMPNYWYRAVIRWNGEAGRPGQLAGVTLPGMPYLVTGSNGEVAWAFTNAQVDETDVIELETDPARPGRYRTPSGWKEFTVRTEEIPIAGGSPRRIAFTNTIWGPVVDPGIRDGRTRVSRWVYEEPEAWRIRYSPLLRATNVAEALTLAPRNPIPVQNFVAGDRSGNIGWTLMGPLPRRVGWDGRLPSTWSDGTRRWAGLKSVPDYPRVFNPSEGLIWTANQRVDGGPAYVDAGDGFPDSGARARQIRDGLRSLTKATPADLLAIQLDDRGVFLDRWHHLLLKALEHPTGTNGAAFAAARPRVEAWGGRALPGSVGFRMVSGFREHVQRRVAEPVVLRCRTQCPEFFIPGGQFEQPLWTLVQERPAHLLNRRYPSWEALLEDAAAATVDAGLQHPGGLAAFTWGDRQRFQMKHPLSLAVPALGRWLDLPAEELPGAPSAMPRIQGRGFGASERFSVGPGWEADGLFQMPGGQSGHFLSPYYRLGHEDWALGRPKPFLAGASQNRLVLSPR